VVEVDFGLHWTLRYYYHNSFLRGLQSLLYALLARVFGVRSISFLHVPRRLAEA
jgi:hypothetical protein